MSVPKLPPSLRERIVFRHGAAASAWLDAVPATAAALARRWGLTFGDDGVASGSNGVVLPCRRADGSAAVLKLSPDTATLARQSNALTMWRAEPDGGSAPDPAVVLATRRTGPDGGAAPDPAVALATGRVVPVPAVLERDDGAGAVLLERIVPGTPLADLAEPPPLDAVAALLHGLHRAPAPDAALSRLGTRFSFLFGLWARRREQSPAAAARVPADALERGLRAAVALAAEPVGRPALVHGDLHAGNVLLAGPAPRLVAIDPQPAIGDPAFDALDLALWRATDRAEVERRIAALAPAAGGDEGRVRSWCAAFAAMLAISLALRGDDADDGQLALLLELAA